MVFKGQLRDEQAEITGFVVPKKATRPKKVKEGLEDAQYEETGTENASSNSSEFPCSHFTGSVGCSGSFASQMEETQANGWPVSQFRRPKADV